MRRKADIAHDRGDTTIRFNDSPTYQDVVGIIDELVAVADYGNLKSQIWLHSWRRMIWRMRNCAHTKYFGSKKATPQQGYFGQSKKHRNGSKKTKKT